MEAQELAILAVAILLYGLASKRLNAGFITLPLAFAGVGFLLGDGGFDLVGMHPDHGAIHLLAELTLVLVLFSDAARLDIRALAEERTVAIRMLLIGLPLAIVIGAGIASLLFPAMGMAAAFVLAAILAPTDAALGQAVVASPEVPVRTRQVLAAESGLNDGLALPAVVGFAIWAGASAEGLAGPADIFAFAALQILLGPLVGAAAAAGGGWMLDRAITRGWVAERFESVAMLAIAVLVFALAETVGGNGFLAAFTGGVVLGWTVRHRCGGLLDFMETEGQILTLFTFLLFGASTLPAALDHLSPAVVLYALASLLVVRVAAIVFSLTGSSLTGASRLFLGWFGPRGLASILFALLILEQYQVPGREAIHACVMVTVAFSVLLHGLSAAPLAHLYGKRMRADDRGGA